MLTQYGHADMQALSGDAADPEKRHDDDQKLADFLRRIDIAVKEIPQENITYENEGHQKDTEDEDFFLQPGEQGIDLFKKLQSNSPLKAKPQMNPKNKKQSSYKHLIYPNF